MIEVVRGAGGEPRFFALSSGEAGYVVALHKGRIPACHHFGAPFVPRPEGPLPLAPPQGFGASEG